MRSIADVVNALTVAQVMSRNPVCIADDASLDEAVALMDQREVSQLPVTCGGMLVGMISRAELLSAVARGLRDANETLAQ